MESKIVYDIFHLTYWDWRIAMDLFLGGLGVGAFLFSIGIMFYKDDDQLSLVKVGSVLGPVALVIGLFFMLSELGQPLRLYKTFLRFNVTSTLSWGGILQQIFLVLSAIFAYMLLTGKNKELRKKIAIFAGCFGLFVACYHGFLLSFVTARPLWNAGAVGVVSIIAALTSGIAAVLLIASFNEKGRNEIKSLSKVIRDLLLVTLIAQFSAIVIWLVTLATGKADFVYAYQCLNKCLGPLFWIGAVLLGLVVPFGILLPYFSSSKSDKPLPITLIAIAILLGGFMFRYVLIIAGQLS